MNEDEEDVKDKIVNEDEEDVKDKIVEEEEEDVNDKIVEETPTPKRVRKQELGGISIMAPF